MTVTAGNVSSSSGNSTTLSWNHTTTSGSDKEIRVCVTLNANESVASVTWDAAGENISGTLIRREVGNPTVDVSVEIWEINNPAGGVTKQIDCVSATKARKIAGAADFSGADADSGVDDVGSNANGQTSVSNSPTNVVADDFVVDCLAMQVAQSATTGANQTDIYNLNFYSTVSGAASYQDGTDGAAMSWTFGSADIAHAAVRIPSVGGGGGGEFIKIIGDGGVAGASSSIIGTGGIIG